MHRKRVLFLAGVVVIGFSALVPLACGSSQALLAAGQTCLAATDCQPGLVCVPTNPGQQDSPRACSDDLSGIQKTEPTGNGGDAAGGGEGGAGEGGGSTGEGGGGSTDGQTPTDTGTTGSPDTGAE